MMADDYFVHKAQQTARVCVERLRTAVYASAHFEQRRAVACSEGTLAATDLSGEKRASTACDVGDHANTFVERRSVTFAIPD